MANLGIAAVLSLSMQAQNHVLQKGPRSKCSVTENKGMLKMLNMLSETILHGLASTVSTRWEHRKTDVKCLKCLLGAASFSRAFN